MKLVTTALRVAAGMPQEALVTAQWLTAQQVEDAEQISRVLEKRRSDIGQSAISLLERQGLAEHVDRQLVVIVGVDVPGLQKPLG